MDTVSPIITGIQILPEGERHLPGRALHLLSEFLGRSRQLEASLRAEFARLEIRIPEGPFCVAIFEVEEQDFSAEDPLQHHRQREYAFERLCSDLSAVMAAEAEGFLFPAMGYLAGILFSEKDRVPGLCESVLRDREAQGRGRFNAVFSRCCSSLSQVTMAWEDVYGRQRGRLFFGNQPEILNGEAMITERESLWSSRFAPVDQQLQQLAQRICGAVLSDQSEQGHVVLDQAVDLMLDEGSHAAYFVEMQMLAALFSARLSGELKQAGILRPEFEAAHAMSGRLFLCHDDQEFRRTAHDCLDDYIGHYRERLQDRSARQMAALRDFLEENAFDQQAGLGMAARHFNTHPATLAAGFRKAYGESVGDYINQVRVRRAKELLQGGGISVQDAAEQVGFCSGTTMYRAFIRYEGRPPGSFKGQKSSNQDSS